MKKITKMLVLALALVVSFSLGASATAEAKVNVSSVKSVDKLTGKKKITLTKGKKATLKTTVTVKPNKAKNKKVTYKSNKTSVATVNSKGVVTAKKAGTAKITVASKKNSKKKATVTVKVVNGKVKKVTLKAEAATVKVGQTTTVKATIKTSGKNANKTLKWTSSNANASVKKNSNTKYTVQALKAGEAKVVAQATDGTKKKANAKITVEGYTVTPKDAKTSVDLEYTSAADVQADLDALAALGVVKDGSFQVTLNDTVYTAEVKSGKVTINGKSVADHAKAKGATKVKVTANVQVSDIAKVVAFAPKSVKSVTVAGAVITDIKADSFKIGETTLGYAIDDKGVITINAADGDVVAAFAKLTEAKLVEVK